jgi:hypothetical protein
MFDLIIWGAVIVYLAGIWKFWTGFTKTNFERTLISRIYLSLLWPAFFIANPSYRRNFVKALKG